MIYSAAVTDLNNITSLPLGTPKPEFPEPTPEPEPTAEDVLPTPEPVAVTFDPLEQKLYWSNFVDGTIHRTDGFIDEIIVTGGCELGSS